jgi:hypothetical protein
VTELGPWFEGELRIPKTESASGDNIYAYMPRFTCWTLCGFGNEKVYANVRLGLQWDA